MIELDLKRPDGKGFKAYFKTVQDVKNFEDLIKTITENAKKQGFDEGYEHARDTVTDWNEPPERDEP